MAIGVITNQGRIDNSDRMARQNRDPVISLLGNRRAVVPKFLKFTLRKLGAFEFLQ
jgi:hypothetical protein